MKTPILPTLLILIIFLQAGAAAVSASETAAGGSVSGKSEQKAADREDGVFIILESANRYTDAFEFGRFTRGGNSGAGTGPFMGTGFEFSKGACNSQEDETIGERRWRTGTLGCSRQLLEADWCARKVSDPAIRYTLHFLSWTIGPEGPGRQCQGRCTETGNRTAYIRTRVR